MSKMIGRGECPQCGPIEITDIELLVLYMTLGLSKPVARIQCEQCDAPYLATLTWEHAYIFDKRGAEVIGFSLASAKPIDQQDINVYMEDFDSNLEAFLNVIDAESESN